MSYLPLHVFRREPAGGTQVEGRDLGEKGTLSFGSGPGGEGEDSALPQLAQDSLADPRHD